MSLSREQLVGGACRLIPAPQSVPPDRRHNDEHRQKNEGLKGHAFGTVEIRTGDHKRLAHKDGIDLAPDADWTERKLVLDLAEIPADGKYVLLSFFLGDATGTARFDDVKLTVRTVKK